MSAAGIMAWSSVLLTKVVTQEWASDSTLACGTKFEPVTVKMKLGPPAWTVLGETELIAGTGEKGDGPEGDPLQCKLSRPHGIFVDGDGNIFIGDSEAHRVRMIPAGR